MKSLFLFLLKYWILVVVSPAIIIPAFFFFRDFTDFSDISTSALMYEVTKYLLPAILIFLVGGGAVAVLAILIGLYLVPTVIRKISFLTFKVSFIIISACIIVAPFALWYGIHHAINPRFLTIVLPGYLVSAIVFGLVLINRRVFASLVG